METSIKKKDCKSCGADFIPFRTFDKFCSAECKIKKEGYTEKKRTRIAQVSDKRKKETTLYLKVRQGYLNRLKNCECCGAPATEIHHKSGRENELLFDPLYFMAICRSCHSWIHNNPKEARDRKWLL